MPRDWQKRKVSQQRYRELNPDVTRNACFRIRFGITLDDYKTMFAKQSGVCAVCGQPETATRKGKVRWLCVDHNHVTGKIRGLLCNDCNQAIGKLHDSAALLESAARYLRTGSY
jgi:hypothetical protein